ncbi:MarR family winged helix-turn-helix transcriptional regulator [Actinospica robiniae]|uniref:MarR family winged helix-turn-helix transcriptional regulator n=1 Tax=Actinospica robiniae TaxID=304901 RepID=UPI000688266E|nr:MarR family transcriptional regulator [Actinospica robiniae]
MPPDAMPPEEPIRWLTADELHAWRSFTLMLYTLPAALEAQLQNDARLSLLEYYVLAGLSEQKTHRMRMSELARLASSELSRLSHLLKRLEKRGLVRREPDPADGRYTLAILTDDGYAHLVASAPGHVTRVRELVLAALDAAEFRALGESSAKIVERIESERPGPA